MNISTSSVKRPVTTLMIVLIVVILGFVSLTRLKMDLYPSIDINYAIVSTSYTGAGPEEMESLITKPLEQALGTANGLKSISSQSGNGSSMIMLEFSDSTDMNYATLQCREKVDQVKGSLPEDASTPMVMKLNPSMMPVVVYAVSSTKDIDLVELNTLIEDQIQPQIEKIDGVASVSISGGSTKEISVEVMPDKLKGYGITVSQISGLLASENLNMPVGTIMQGDADLTVKTVGEFKSVEDIRNLPITTASGITVYLRDVANINEKFVEQTEYTFVNGQKAIGLVAQKQSDANTVDVANSIKKEMDKVSKNYPDLSFSAVLDQSEFIEASISNVASSAITGAFFAILVLFLFLRNVRSTLIIGTAIPVSIISTLFLMDMAGIGLNVISLSGLALGVGMLVDNAIVVLENIFTQRDKLKKSRVEAAILGAKQVAMAVFASTLTTIAVFFPMLFVEGFIGQIFKQLALTVSFALIASLLVALTWVPMASSKILKISKFDPEKRNIFQKILDKWGDLLIKLDQIYKRVLKWSLSHKKIVSGLTLLFFIGTLALVPTIGMDMLGSSDEGSLSIDVSMPKGSQSEETLKTAERVLSSIEGISEIDEIYLTVGGSGMRAMMMGSSADTASITVNLVDLKERKRSTNEIVEEVRQIIKDIPGPTISVSASSSSGGMSGGGSDISLEVYGDDLEILETVANDFKDIIESVQGTREVTTSLDESTPEAVVVINRDKAALYGISAGQVSTALSAAVRGNVATKYKVDGTEIDVRVRQNPENINYITDISNISIQSPKGGAVPLTAIADIRTEDAPTTVTRLDQKRYVTVSSGIYGRDLKSVSDDIDTKLKDYIMPKGFSYKFAGTYEEMMESFASLGLALILAIVLVYMIMASQFESLRYPFIILLAVPLSLTGGILGLILMRNSLSVVAFIGLIMLAGIVVNNGIVLIDYINQLREEGMDMYSAILEGGPSRLRPILMTTLTTVLALFPMMVNTGSSSEMQKPLAIVVVFGLTISTIVTLIFVPVTYSILDDLKSIVKRNLKNIKGLFKRKKAKA